MVLVSTLTSTKRSVTHVLTSSLTCISWGYSLTFSHKAGPFIGTLDNFGFMGVLAQPSVGSTRIPDLMFAVYQGMFAAIT